MLTNERTDEIAVPANFVEWLKTREADSYSCGLLVRDALAMLAAAPQQVAQPSETAAALHEVRAHLSHINKLLDDAVSVALAKPEQAAQPWMPIETAPKDGTRVLLVIDHGEWGDKIWTGLWANGWVVSYGKTSNQPTHWMPLPAEPHRRKD